MYGTEDFLGHEFAGGDEFTSERINLNKAWNRMGDWSGKVIRI